VYLIGDCAEAFFDSWKDCVSCEISMVLENAVKSAKRDASGGDVVLLSPGCASYDQFKNFEVRGETFAKLVKKEG
jgi:UDP-N-acetylmuramoylalanine--D-glutamate ligase